MSIHAYAARKAQDTLTPFDYEPTPLAPEEVEIKISHCGICHSDIHLLNNDWGVTRYPFVPGHEIVGKIVAKGSAVRHLEINQRVGVGWQRSACLECDLCLQGYEQLCKSNKATCVGYHGGFADFIRSDAHFAFPIPDALDSAVAAPLLCGGITVYSPLVEHNIQSHHKVGVIGVGGLGHMAILFLKAMGCEIFAFSSSPSKKEEVLKMGATHFVDSTDPKAIKNLNSSLDFIVSTVMVSLDWASYLTALRANGKLCFVGASAAPMTLPPVLLLMGQKSICGSAIGNRKNIRQMLEFSARHRLSVNVESLPMEKVNQAIDKVKHNQARFRMVLETGS